MDVERTINFILEHEANLAVSIQRLEASVETHEASIQGLMTGFAEFRENQIQMQKQQLWWQDGFGRALLGLVENFDNLQKSQQKADERLAAFVR